MFMKTLVSILLVGIIGQLKVINGKQPHIIFMLADDLGWNDVGYHNSKMLTPNLDSLATSGIILNQSYVQNMCTPSRAALLTGYFPFRTGMQTMVIPTFAAMGVPLQFELLPKRLKKLGYATHIVGKWHLGGCSSAYSPLNRGFDTFFGYTSGGQDYYDHSSPFLGSGDATLDSGAPNVYDFWNQSNVAVRHRSTYSSIPFVNQVENVLKKWNGKKPIFLYLPFQLTHSPLQVPSEMLDFYPNETNNARKKFSAMASMLDSDVGKIVKLLEHYNLYNDSIIIFSADNGGEVRAGGCNYPLRGAKHTLYEGGHRAVGFVHSPLLNKTGFTYNGMIHIVDWYPTIVKLAGGRPDSRMDGIDIWSALTENFESPRTEFVYHLEYDKLQVGGAIRFGDWKLIVGKAGLPNYRVPPEQVQGLYERVPGGNNAYDDTPNHPKTRLYYLKMDPTEQQDLSELLPFVKAQLLLRLQHYRKMMVDSVFTPNDLNLYRRSNPNLTYIGRDWCKPITRVNLVNWNDQNFTDLFAILDKSNDNFENAFHLPR